jgi:hypothetical protein
MSQLPSPPEDTKRAAQRAYTDHMGAAEAIYEPVTRCFALT